MKSVVISIVLAGALVAAAEPVSFDISQAANKDVVYEPGPGARAEAFGGNADGVHAFGVEGSMDGLPKNRYVPSTDPDLGNYVLLPYSGPNVIELCTLATVPAENKPVDVPNNQYSKIGMLVSAVDGDCSFTIKLQYEDGSVDTLWWEADDWYDLGPRGNLQKVLRDMDRVEAKTGLAEDSNHFNIYEFILDAPRGLRPDKKLQAIVIGSDPNRWPDDQARYAGVFAVNGAAVKKAAAPSTPAQGK